MRIKKPFKAVPIKPDPNYMKIRNKRESGPDPSPVHSIPTVLEDVQAPYKTVLEDESAPDKIVRSKPKLRKYVTRILVGAAIIGALGGIGIALVDKGRWATVADHDGEGGIGRKRVPQPGDFWSGCNAAREAGTTPIYRSESGYRPEMDDDGDGIACEP